MLILLGIVWVYLFVPYWIINRLIFVLLSVHVFFSDSKVSMQMNQPQSISIGIEVRYSHVVLLRVTHLILYSDQQAVGKKANISAEKGILTGKQKKCVKKKRRINKDTKSEKNIYRKSYIFSDY